MITFFKHLRELLQPGQTYYGFNVLDLDSTKVLLQNRLYPQDINYYSLKTHQCLSDPEIPFLANDTILIAPCLHAVRQIAEAANYLYRLLDNRKHLILKVILGEGKEIKKYLFSKDSYLTTTTGGGNRSYGLQAKLSGVIDLTSRSSLGIIDVFLNLGDDIKIYVENKNNWSDFVYKLNVEKDVSDPK